MRTFAPPPPKTTVGFTLQWGDLVQVHVRLLTAVTDTTPIKRSQYTNGNKVCQPKMDSVTMKPATDIKLMVAVEDKLVELSDEEMGKATSDFAVNRSEAVPVQFVALETIGTRYRVEKWYQARSGLKKVGEKSVPDAHFDKVFALLLQSMAKKKVACLFRTSLKGPARWAALTPDGNVHFLYYDDEVRGEFGWPEVTISKSEAAAGLELVDAKGVTEPELPDERGAALRAFVEKKARDGKTIDAPADAGGGIAPVLDLTAALAASVEQAKANKKAPAKKAAATRKKAS